MDKPKRRETRIERRGRGHRSGAEREQLVGEYRDSGLTQEQFAAQAGLKIGTLRAWIYQKRRGVSRAGGHFAPVRLVDALPVTKSPGSVTVRWPQGLEVELAVALDESGALRLVRELVTPCLR